MPIYMIIPRYNHNYAQFCQLLNSNLFTHRRILMLLREATSETYGPRVYSHHINLHHFIYLLLLLLFTLHLCTKNTKNIILSSLSDLTFASGREGIDNLFIALVARFIFVCVGARDSCVASYWIGTLVLKTEGNTYATLLHHPFLFNEIQGSAQEVAMAWQKDTKAWV